MCVLWIAFVYSRWVLEKQTVHVHCTLRKYARNERKEGESECQVVSDSLRPNGLYPTGLLCPWDSPGKNTGMGRHFLFQVIFPTQGSNPGPPHCGQMLKPLSHQGSPTNIFISTIFRRKYSYLCFVSIFNSLKEKMFSLSSFSCSHFSTHAVDTTSSNTFRISRIWGSFTHFPCIQLTSPEEYRDDTGEIVLRQLG